MEHFDGNLTAHKLELKNLKFSLSYFVEPTIDYKLGWKLAFESRLESDDYLKERNANENPFTSQSSKAFYKSLTYSNKNCNAPEDPLKKIKFYLNANQKMFGVTMS